MRHSTSTVRSLSRELERQFDVRPGEDAVVAMRRIDGSAARAVCRHLLGELAGASGRPAGSAAMDGAA